MSSHRPPRIGVLLSGTGRTLVNFLDCIRDGKLDAAVACVISDRPDVRGLQHATDAGIPTTVTRDTEAIFAFLDEQDVDLVCLCGYLRLLEIPERFAGRALNIHPSLLPKYGGQGFYGHHVHRAVLAAGEAETGCTVHLCDAEYDRGTILLQEKVPVLPGDGADDVAARVFAAECEAYPKAVRAWIAAHMKRG